MLILLAIQNLFADLHINSQLMATFSHPPKEQLQALYDKARATGCWFLGEGHNDWKTPEEFKEIVEAMMISASRENVQRMFIIYTLRNPISGIIGRMRRMEKATEDLRLFTQKVKEYYDLTPKPENDDERYM